jgi:hypothetical protein
MADDAVIRLLWCSSAQAFIVEIPSIVLVTPITWLHLLLSAFVLGIRETGESMADVTAKPEAAKAPYNNALKTNKELLIEEEPCAIVSTEEASFFLLPKMLLKEIIKRN